MKGLKEFKEAAEVTSRTRFIAVSLGLFAGLSPALLGMCSAKPSSLRSYSDEPIIEAAQTGPRFAKRAAVSYFIQSTHSSENCCRELARL
jgi:hypothetical protein